MTCPATGTGATPAILGGPVSWSCTRDREGHKEYKIVHRVHADDTPGFAHGPASVLDTPGLPIPGGIWDFDNDFDVNAFCTLEAKVSSVYEGERCKYYLVEQTYSSKPSDICLLRYGTGAHDPLAEQVVISGGFGKYTEQMEYDKDGSPILNSAFEALKGPGTEFDASRATIRVTKNEAFLALSSLVDLIDNVNNVTMWGFDARCVKLSNITWERKFYDGCSCYFAITYEFECKPPKLSECAPGTSGYIPGFDRCVLDQGTKVLHGQWNVTTRHWDLININGSPPNPLNPTHFDRYKDPNGNLARVLLNHGLPVTLESDAGHIFVEYYPEVDFITALGIPDDLECPL